jgi:hypothetical protein
MTPEKARAPPAVGGGRGEPAKTRKVVGETQGPPGEGYDGGTTEWSRSGPGWHEYC